MVHIQKYTEDKLNLLPLFRLADDSESEIKSYFQLGDVLVALDNDQIVGMAQVEQDGNHVQIISLAVLPEYQGKGIGSRLIEAAVDYCRAHDVHRLIVCTAAWDKDNVAFYGNRGFRLFHTEVGFFTPEKGYDEIGDQVQFEMHV